MKIRKKFENIWYAATKCIVNVFRSFNAIRKIQTSGNSRVLRKSIILFQSNSLLIIFFRSLTHTRNTSPITTYVYYKSLKQRKVKNWLRYCEFISCWGVLISFSEARNLSSHRQTFLMATWWAYPFPLSSFSYIVFADIKGRL